MAKGQGQFSIDINNCGFFDTQIQLGAALASNNLQNFRLALDMGAEATVEDDNHMSIFEKTLKTHGCGEFVEECLRRGCDPNYVNRHLNKAAINFATDSRDPRILSALLSCKGIQIDRKYADLTPLNSLAKNLTAENANEVSNCISLLLECGASPNIPDQREMTPLHYILKNRKIDADQKRNLVQQFLDIDDLDVDTYRDAEVREIIRDQYPDMRLPPVRSTEANPETLLTHLRRGDEIKFSSQFATYQRNQSKDNNLNNASQQQNLQLLVESIKRGLHDAFDSILQSNVNLNQLHEGSSPVELSARWGNWRALQQLLNQEGLKLRRQDQLLTTAIKHLDETPFNDFADYQKCFDILLESKHVDVNEADPSGSTPLHYAVKYRNRDAIKRLLNRGAYIGMKSAFNDLPIDGMHPELLQEHFDNCISTNALQPGDENFEIVMDYKNLIPPQNELITSRPSDSTQQKLREEMAPITFITENKEYRHLLQHPLITSFLFLKWHRLSVVFYINFIIYVSFAVSIVTHTILKFTESEKAGVTIFFGILSWVGIAYLILRELTQVIMSPSQYLRSPINVLEIALIVLSILTCSESSYDHETNRVIAVFTILLVALELCLLVGSLPVLSISTHMLMLRAVSKSFLKSFALYSIFVITFSLCFYILFGKPEEAEPTADPSGANSEGEFNKFTNPFTAVIKTIVMLTGEFDAGDIDFDSMFSYFIFLLFVVFMSIVLFNLLNGLAVSDTQAIKTQAELNGSICRANLLSRYEQVLTGRSGRAGFIVNHEPFRTICRRLMNLYPSYLIGRQIAIMPNDRNKIMVPITNAYEMKGMQSCGNGVHNSKANFVPLTNGDTEYQKKLLDPPITFLRCCCSCAIGKCSEMDSRTVKLAMAVLEQRTAKRNISQSTEKRLQSIEVNQERLFQMLLRIEAKLNASSLS